MYASRPEMLSGRLSGYAARARNLMRFTMAIGPGAVLSASGASCSIEGYIWSTTFIALSLVVPIDVLVIGPLRHSERMIDGDRPFDERRPGGGDHLRVVRCEQGGQLAQLLRVLGRQLDALGRIRVHVEEPGARRSLGDLELPAIGENSLVVSGTPEHRLVRGS